MKIIEVRDGFIKFEADENIYLSAFVEVRGFEKCYVAQIIQIKKAAGIAVAYAKILFLYNGESLQNYDRTLPERDAEIFPFDFNVIANSISVKEPVIIGKTLGENINITVDSSELKNKSLVSIDNREYNNIFVNNLVTQFNNLNKKVIIIDTLGVVNAKKYVAGKDFKLPLDTASLKFMYEDCLNDATADSKSMIVDIFKDLSDYSETVPFLPFNTLKTIVDDMVNKSHIFKLLVLKNKLAKFESLGYFATKADEVQKTDLILNSKYSVIDLSKLDSTFQNRYLAFLYEKLEKYSDVQVILEMSNVVSKRNIKNILSSENINTVILTHSQFKYLNDIKDVFSNYIVEPSKTNNEVFNVYSTFLASMGNGDYLIVGEFTNYIPIVSKFKKIDDVIEYSAEQFADDNVLDEIAEIAEDYEQEKIAKDYEPEEQAENVSVIDLSEDTVIANIDKKANEAIESISSEAEPMPDTNVFDDAEKEVVESTKQEVIDETVIQNEITESDNEEIEALNIESDSAEQESSISDESENDIQEQDLDIVTEETENNFDEIESVNQEDISEQENIIIDEEPLETEVQIDNDLNMVLDYSEDYSQENIDVEIPADDAAEIPDNAVEPNNDEIKIMPINDSNQADEFDNSEIVEIDASEIQDDDIIVDISDGRNDSILDESTEEQIVKDVDSVYTTLKDDDISETDLDFIDEINEDENKIVLEEVPDDDSILEELTESDDGIIEDYEAPVVEEPEYEPEILETRQSSTPIVPVYDADIPQEDVVVSDPLQQGDSVTHAKYGSGVVEKMIKYGNKTLLAINFENIGRRLLDPTLTEIKKA